MSVTGKAIALLEAGVPSALVPDLAGAQRMQQQTAEFFGIWDFATRVGAPLKDALIELSALERDSRAADYELQQSLALPRATKNLMIWLPVFGLFLSQAFGLQPFSAFQNPLGIFSFGVAIALLFFGERMAEKMIRALSMSNHSSSLNLLLLAIALRAGLGITEAKDLLPPKNAQDEKSLEDLLELSLSTGAPISQILISSAKENREANTSLAIQDARALSVKLLIPLGLTVLPAFLLLTVVPVLISQITR